MQAGKARKIGRQNAILKQGSLSIEGSSQVAVVLCARSQEGSHALLRGSVSRRLGKWSGCSLKRRRTNAGRFRFRESTGIRDGERSVSR